MFDLPESWKDLMTDTDMKVEEFQDDGHLVVRAEMPGIDPDKDVEITVEDPGLAVLTIATRSDRVGG
jgi:HSP20 family molecular chaperone IbpA